MKCPFCESEISATARKCKHCGEWVSSPAQPPKTSPQASPAPQPISHHHVNVNVPAQQAVAKQESAAFAVITLIVYIFVFPLGMLLNLIGLITGPKRGCFLWLLLVFVVLPIAIVVLILLISPDAFEEFRIEFERSFEQSRQSR